MHTCFILPSRLDSSAATDLKKMLIERLGKPITLSASEVKIIGALAFEVIISAHHQWEIDGLEFSIVEPSSTFKSVADKLGLCISHPWRPKTRILK